MKRCLILVILLTRPQLRADDTGATLFAAKCASCHGAKAEGDQKQQAPSLASLPDWYLTKQINKFKKEIRGAKAEDLDGLKMKAIAHTLKPAELKMLATHISKLSRVQSAFTLKGDVDQGRELFRENCMACHRYNGSGEKFFGSPPLTGLQDWYIHKQLKKFRQGIRGDHKEDIEGKKMHVVTGTLEKKDLLDIATFIPHLAKNKARHTRRDRSSR